MSYPVPSERPQTPQVFKKWRVGVVLLAPSCSCRIIDDGLSFEEEEEETPLVCGSTLGNCISLWLLVLDKFVDGCCLGTKGSDITTDLPSHFSIACGRTARFMAKPLIYKDPLRRVRSMS